MPQPIALDTQSKAQYDALRNQLRAKGIRFGAADRELEKLGYSAEVFNPHKAGGFSKIGGAIGDVGRIAAPILAATGVGAPLAIGLGAASGALGSLNDRGGPSIGNALKGAAIGGGAAGAGALAHGAMSKMGGAGGIKGAIGKVGGMLTGGGMPGGEGGGILGDVLGFAKKNPGMILGGIGAIQGARQASKAADLQNEAVNLAKAQHAARQPFQQALTGALANRQAVAKPNFAAQFADRGNPYGVIARR